MGKKTNIFLSFNTPFGLLMGGSFTIASYMYFQYNGNIYANPALDRTLTFLYVIGLFIQIRRYRENAGLQGYISYGEAVKTGSYLSAVTAFVYAVYTFFVYSAHPETLTNYLTTVENVIKEVYPNSPLAGSMTQMLHAFTTPLSMGFSEFISKALLGVIYSLIIAAFLKKRKPTES